MRDLRDMSVGIFRFLSKKRKEADYMSKVRKMTECGVAIALAVILSFVVLWRMPQGGSVSLVMVPLFIVSYRHGAAWGVMSGAVYSLLALMIDGAIYHPLSVLLDYILAFGAVGVAGFFKTDLKGIIVGTVLGVLGRFIFSFLSGWLLFASYAPEGQNAFVYSLVYQASYLVPELVLNILVMVLLFKKTNKLF